LKIDQQFNNAVFMIQSDASYLSLTFTTCLPTSRVVSRGAGFSALVKFSGKRQKSNIKNTELLDSCASVLKVKDACILIYLTLSFSFSKTLLCFVFSQMNDLKF
jgi:hypothetical protein